ncbi:unnamed protein product [Mytilus coruscus]|uniref:Uncharacterized protein n=1 Tax=Mytilus coruscus TaxID=42192 RepID=A0A6J8B2Y3_MYTCO|nr:unnamed protein product [Mytilus coruscus]
MQLNFRTGKQMPQTIATTPEDNLKKRKTSYSGRPKNDTEEHGFQAIMLKIEKDQKQISIANLVREMEKIFGVENTYSVVLMKKKILDYFGKSVLFTEEEGKPNILTFRDNISSILHTFCNRRGKENKEEEKKSITSTAAQLIKEDIKLITSKDIIYPSAEEMESETSIGHAIIQATRPRSVIAPLQIGLGIQMHHHFGSRFLVDTLYNF